jgi:hypothetical protein
MKLQHGTVWYKFNNVSEETTPFILETEVRGSFETLTISARLHGITLQKTLLIAQYACCFMKCLAVKEHQGRPQCSAVL